MEAAHPIWRPLGQLLVDKNLLSQDELEAVLVEQSSTGRRLGEIIVERRLVSGPALTAALAEQWGIVLTTESGFGTGLRAQIDARHRAARMRQIGAQPEGEISLDVVAEVIDVLAEAHDEDFRFDPAPAPEHELEPTPADPPVEAQVHHLPAPAELHLLFIPTPDGYRLAEAAGHAPAVGTLMAAGVVSRIGPSPLPGDPRRCAYLLPE